MTIEEISEILHARILRGEQWKNHEVHSAYGCDLMSDVLAHSNDQDLLLTGLCNPQSIRTAEMMDFTCIVFVRSKQPTPEMLDLAEQNGISVLSTDLRMYTACGLLYTNGLIGANDDR